MCGICGIVNFNHQPVDRNKIKSMTDALIHRGPDDEGLYFSADFKTDGKGQAGFGFRRLSIIDVQEGHQPMRFKNFEIVFNGEIYNFKELKKELENSGEQFKTHSDTEVLIHLYAKYGEKCLEKLNGMFAFAIWNEEQSELFMARDRLGIKPLYYFYDGKSYSFASGLKSLFRSGNLSLEFDPIGIMDYFSYRFVPAPYTILKNVKKVLPGYFIRVKENSFEEKSYWNLESRPFESLVSEERIGDQLTELINDSVRMQMVSDVPLGSFLSGGVDSSLITAFMCRNSKEKIKTFSIGFEKGTGVDESPHARKVAQFLGTEHHELILNERDMDCAEQVFSKMNEPVADPTILPTAILSEFARKEVKVVLTGEGGDELFAGYNRYKSLLYSDWIRNSPSIFRPLLSFIFRKAGRGESFDAIPNVNSENWFPLNRDFSEEILKTLFHGEEFRDWKSYIFSHPFSRPILFKDSLNTVLDLERRTSLTDRLLMKVDMAAMGKSLEARPPFLDHRIVEFAFKVPAEYKIRNFKGKYILRKIAERYLPKEICQRRKHGFIVPIAKWINANSKNRIESVLDDSFFSSAAIFDRESIQKIRQKIYNNNDQNAAVLLWPLMVLSYWVRSLKNGN